MHWYQLKTLTENLKIETNLEICQSMLYSNTNCLIVNTNLQLEAKSEKVIKTKGFYTIFLQKIKKKQIKVRLLLCYKYRGPYLIAGIGSNEIIGKRVI